MVSAQKKEEHTIESGFECECECEISILEKNDEKTIDIQLKYTKQEEKQRSTRRTKHNPHKPKKSKQ